ncbi:hypothetical protein U0070_006980 [Myodes glareolus]|uniref:G-protein coupled receptors family 1 profile domain-containing protein n=1 Tax=Myodes glareolus TaxID=447135 RepID=A0AAW0ICG0_MYOGA
MHSGRMGASNVSTTSDFTLVGLFSNTGPHLILFFLVATMFTAGLLGNTILIFLIATDSRLHTPMYFLLNQLSLLDIGFLLVTIPKMVADFLQERNVITFRGCATQMFFLMLMGVSEGALVASILTSITLRFPYCASHTVDYFFCELPALLKLSCADTSAYELALSVSGVLILLLPLSLVFTSYGHVLGAVLRIRSAKARHKAFTTCSSHMAVVSLFYGAALFMYMVPGSYHSPQQDNMVSLFYSLITPTLNPLIYSLRNREVPMAFVKAMGRADFRVKQ